MPKDNGEAPKITSITIGPHTKDGDGIVTQNTIEIPVPKDFQGVEYEVKVTTDQEGVEIEFDPPLKDGNKIEFTKVNSYTDLEKTFTIRVKKYGKETSYKVKAIMMTHQFALLAARYRGKDSSTNPKSTWQILNHKNVNMTIYGKIMTVIVASQIYYWKTVRINNINVLTPQSENTYFKGYGKLDIPLEAGKKMDMEVIVSNSEWDESTNKPKTPHLATEKFKFSIDCSAEEADAFISTVKVNKIDITDEQKDDDAFTSLFDDTETPEIEIGSKASVSVELSKKVEKVRIGTIEIKEKDLELFTNAYGFDAWKAEVEDIEIEAGASKEIEIVVTPKAYDVGYRETIMKIRLVNAGSPPLLPSLYDINGLAHFRLPKDFKNGLEEDKNPEYYVDINTLNLKLFFKNEPKKVSMIINTTTYTAEGADKIKRNISSSGTSTWEVCLSGAIGNEEKQVRLSFEPKETSQFSNGEYKFRIIGTTDKPQLSPIFDEISKNMSLPKKDFLDRLTDGSKPVYKVKGDSAKLFIYLTEYEHDSLLDVIKVNDVPVTANEFKFIKYFVSNRWVLVKSIKNLTEDGIDIKIEFNAKPEGGAESVKWEFKLAKGGGDPKTPIDFIKLGVNEYGEGAMPFTDEFQNALRNGDEPPLLETYGQKINVRLRTKVEDYLKLAKFKLDDRDEVVVMRGAGEWLAFAADYTFKDVELNTEHTISITIEPDSDDYSPLKMKFKVKTLSKLPSPQYEFYIDENLTAPGYKAKLNKDFARFTFQTIEDNVVDKVEIGLASAPKMVEVTNFINQDDNKIYQATKLLDIDVSKELVYVIKVTPKNTAKYATVICKYYLQGSALDENNASFVLRSNRNPDVKIATSFREGINGKYSYDYGASSAFITANTMSKNSTAKVIKINPVNAQEISGESAVVLTRAEGSHEVSGTVVPYTDKPTKFKLYVEGKNGRVDNKNGVYKFELNPIPLFWSYKKVSNIKKAFPTYAEIEVSKSQVKNNKIYIFVAPWKERYGYKVANPVDDEISTFKKIGDLGLYQDLFRLTLNVSSMNANDNKEIVCRIVQNSDNKEAISYKIKVIMKE